MQWQAQAAQRELGPHYVRHTRCRAAEERRLQVTPRRDCSCIPCTGVPVFPRARDHRDHRLWMQGNGDGRANVSCTRRCASCVLCSAPCYLLHHILCTTSLSSQQVCHRLDYTTSFVRHIVALQPKPTLIICVSPYAPQALLHICIAQFVPHLYHQAPFAPSPCATSFVLCMRASRHPMAPSC